MIPQKLKVPDFVDADTALDLQMYGRYIAFLRRHPIHAIRVLWGIITPPHEAAMVNTAWAGYASNIYTCSRGTSKSFTIGSLFGPTKSLLFKGSNVLIASASKFRGGKVVLLDASRLLRGVLASQKMGLNWGAKSLAHAPTYLKKDPDMWYMEFKSGSQVTTIPTGNEESARGLRAHILIVDERNSFEGEVLQKVYAPYLAVGSDFENPALGSEGNQMFYVGTVDYTYKDWFRDIQASLDTIKLEFQTQKALRQQDWHTYDHLMDSFGTRLRSSSISYTRYDYTDLLIPTEVDGFQVIYPGAKDGKQIKFDERSGKNLIFTYPVDTRQIEGPLDNGMVDFDTWAAEHRNQFIQADGNVYPYDLIERATGPIFTAGEERKRKWDADEIGYHYLPPVLFECQDPCVLGVDTARSQDFTAFVVIRLGMFAQGEYDLTSSHGKTPFANVIWAEQHQQMMVKDIAEKIREFKSRYNIVTTRDCPGIAMDARGGGTNVRDELVFPSPPVDQETGQAITNWTMPQRIYDPDDKDERIGKNLLTDLSAWGGLRLLYTTDILNQELVGFSKAQMQTSKLFIGSSKAKRFIHDPNNRLYPAYVGVEILKHQLLRIQANLTPMGKSIRYEMPGDPQSIENKRDMLFAFLYACFPLRSWVTTQLEAKIQDVTTYAEVVYFGRTL